MHGRKFSQRVIAGVAAGLAFCGGASADILFTVELSTNPAIPEQSVQQFRRSTGTVSTRLTPTQIANAMQIVDPTLVFLSSYVRVGDLCAGPNGAVYLAQGQLNDSSYSPPRPAGAPGIGAVLRIADVDKTPSITVAAASNNLSNVIGVAFDPVSAQAVTVVNPGSLSAPSPRIEGLVAVAHPTGAQTVMHNEAAGPLPRYVAGSYIQTDPRGLPRTFLVTCAQGGVNSPGGSTAGGPQLYRLTYDAALNPTLTRVVDFTNTTETGVAEDFVDGAIDPFAGGSVRGIAIVPGNTTHVYVAFRFFGIWRVTLDAAGSYAGMTQILVEDGLDALEYDPYANKLIYGVDNNTPGEFGLWEVNLDGSNPTRIVPNVKVRGIEAIPGAVFVRAAAPAGGTGQSWSTAFRDLQDALDYLRATPDKGLRRQAWVARGSYKPDRATLNRLHSFELVSNTDLYGGFFGNETQLSQRNVSANRSILTADLAGDDNYATIDSRNSASRLENAVNIVDVVSASNARLDGFTLQGSWSNLVGTPGERGGGVLNDLGMPLTIANCTFFVLDGSFGTAIYSTGSPRIENCTFNAAWTLNHGAGAAFSGPGTPVVLNCTFIDCLSTHNGAAIAALNGSSPAIINSRFLSNTVLRDHGGAVYIRDNSHADFQNCIFSNNVTAGNSGGLGRGGAVALVNSASASMTGCTFAGNTAATDGDSIYLGGSSNASLHNSIVWGHDALPNAGAQALHFGGTLPVTSHSCIEGLAAPLAGSGNIGNPPRFSLPRGADNIAGTLDDQFNLLPNSRCIDAGSNAQVPADTHDIDGDADAFEPLPFDNAGAFRQADDAGTADTGVGPAPVVDIGALEFQGNSCAADFDGSGSVNATDIFIFLDRWFAENGMSAPAILTADFDGSGVVNATDIFIFLDTWFMQTGNCF